MTYIFDLFYLVCFLSFVKKPINFEGQKKFQYYILNLYLVLLYGLTLFPFRPLKNILFDGLVPNVSLFPYIDIIYGRGPAVQETLLNIVLFLPLGYLVSKLYKLSLSKTLFWGFCLSFTVEFLQLFNSYRASDITDIINNSLGTFLGALISFNHRAKKNK